MGGVQGGQEAGTGVSSGEILLRLEEGRAVWVKPYAVLVRDRRECYAMFG